MTTFKSLLLAACLASPAGATTTEIKFATLAPEGSTWMKTMHEFDKELRAKTEGRVGFKFYAGGVQGDEKDVVRKMRVGQLAAAGVTGVGLGEVAPEVRVMDAPLLFRDAAEVDAVLKKYDKELRSAIEAKGFVPLGWAEVGFVYLFTAAPVHAPTDLKSAKMWVWEGDPIAEAAFKAFGVSPIPLSVTDVMSSLETGLINGVYGSPMAVVALQWFSKEKYVYSLPLADASGAVLVTKKAFEGLSEADRKVLLEVGKTYMDKLTRLAREENKKALEAVQKQGLKLTSPDPSEITKYEEMGRQARRGLVGRMYSAELLDRVEKTVDEQRSSKSKHGKAAKG
jgi:TRAP-type C4-dicarboxylate transport system substrate-binding protein